MLGDVVMCCSCVFDDLCKCVVVVYGVRVLKRLLVCVVVLKESKRLLVCVVVLKKQVRSCKKKEGKGKNWQLAVGSWQLGLGLGLGFGSRML